MQDASERGGDLARLERLREQLADAGGERLLRQNRAAIAAHQHDRQIGPLAAQHSVTAFITAATRCRRCETQRKRGWSLMIAGAMFAFIKRQAIGDCGQLIEPN